MNELNKQTDAKVHGQINKLIVIQRWELFFSYIMEQITRGLKAGMGVGWVASIPDGCSGFSSGLRAVCL